LKNNAYDSTSLLKQIVILSLWLLNTLQCLKHMDIDECFNLFLKSTYIATDSEIWNYEFQQDIWIDDNDVY